MTFDKLLSECWNYFSFDVFLVLAAAGVWYLWRRLVPPRLGQPLPAGLRLSALLKFSAGAIVGLTALAVACLPGLAGGGFAPGPGYAPFTYAEGSSFGAAGLIWGFFAVQSLFEELAFRGIGLGLLGVLLYWLACLVGPRASAAHGAARTRVIYQRWAWLISGLAANCAVSLAFGFIHRHNPHVDSFALANIVLAGLVLGQLYWQHGQPLGAWACHWVWNAGQASLGLPVSGIAIGPPLLDGLGFTGARAGALSGGAFGLEGSWPCSLALALALACLLAQQCGELARLARRN